MKADADVEFCHYWSREKMIHTQRGNEGIDGHTQRTGRGLLWTKEKEEQKERFNVTPWNRPMTHHNSLKLSTLKNRRNTSSKTVVETDKSTVNVKSNFTSLYFLRKF